MKEQDRINELHRLIIRYQRITQGQYLTIADRTKFEVDHAGLSEEDINEIRSLFKSFEEKINKHLEGIKKRYEEAIYNFNKTPQP